MFNNSTYFEFNNKSSELFDGIHSLIIVSDNDTMETQFGSTQELIKESDYFNFGQQVNYGFKQQSYQAELTLLLVKEYRNKDSKVYHRESIEMTDILRETIATFLLHNRGQYSKVSFDEREDLVYDMSILSIKKVGISNINMGMLKCNVDFASQTPSTRTLVNNYTIRDNQTKQIIIENKSNITNYSRPYVNVRMLDNSTKLIIKNINTNKETIFDNMPLNMEISIYGDTKEIVCSDSDYRYGIKSNFNRVFPEIKDGFNTFEITGNCNISFQASFPMAQ